ncbi:MAG: DSD1 family PLP-dependent enzyme [Alphaproteobacteria bacterium]|nr:DSD1 family PLP-dependent enzyme [Alphaproteobacteria bacterium]
MTIRPPAEIGMAADDVDTPALLVDLDAFEHNIALMARMVASFGVNHRPHAKTHKSPDVARRQIAAGAVGQCCQKVGEAEVLVAGGIEDVLVSNQVVGPRKLDRLAALARQASIGVCVDDAGNIEDINAAAKRFGSTVEVLVEVDIGAGRCGVMPGAPAVVLAKKIDAASNLKFGGLQAYQGRAQHIRGHGERKVAIDKAGALVKETVAKLTAAGLDCRLVTGAGTGTFQFEARSGVWNELQAGSYCFMDADYSLNLSEDGEFFDTFRQSLFVLATVMSHPTRDRAVLDAGLKASSIDAGLPRIADLLDVTYVGASDEHGTLALGVKAPEIKLGDKLRLIPGHCDPTVNLHDWYVGIRGGVVESLWPVAARGAGF